MRRGRPTISRPSIDLGTPELQAKRRLSLTTETIDQLLAHDLLSQDQHWCAVHFRWLYTLRYGAPTPYVTELVAARGHTPNDDPQWREAREAEYHEAATLLHHAGVMDEVMDMLLFTPSLTLRQSFPIVPAVREGLDILCSLWCNRSHDVRTPPCPTADTLLPAQ